MYPSKVATMREDSRQSKENKLRKDEIYTLIAKLRFQIRNCHVTFIIFSAVDLKRKASITCFFNPIFLSALQPQHTPPGSSYYSHVFIFIPFKTFFTVKVTNLDIFFA